MKQYTPSINQTSFVKITSLADPAKLAFIVDSGKSWARWNPGFGNSPPVNGVINKEQDWGGGSEKSPFNWAMRHRYEGGNNVGFADGHLSYSRNLQLDYLSDKLKVLNE